MRGSSARLAAGARNRSCEQVAAVEPASRQCGGSAVSKSYEGASPEQIRHHYDVGNEFYDLWLDETRTYSCALYSDSRTDESLADAQRRKLDYYAAQMRASGVGRVLDVGCGWGSMMRRLVDCHNVSSAVGLTLSPSQVEAVTAIDDPRIEVRLENWIAHDPDARYDAIVSLGAFEHFAGYAMKRAETGRRLSRVLLCLPSLARAGWTPGASDQHQGQQSQTAPRRRERHAVHHRPDIPRV